ncbi:MAG: DUF4261 domain-containing protein [Pirellulales bacterium]
MSFTNEEVATVYSVQLLYAQQPKVSKTNLLNHLEKSCPGITPLDGIRDSGLLAFMHPDYTNPENKLPAQWMITPAALDNPGNISSFSASLEQSWSWPEAEATVKQCQYSVSIGDVLASWMPALDRLSLIQKMVTAVMEVAPCDAIHWHPTEQFIDPEAFSGVMESPDIDPWLVPGAVNIRHYSVAGYGNDLDETSEDMIADSLGLGVLGLPDLQCHFKSLDYEAIVQWLYNHAISTFEKGETLSEGQSVAGLKPGQVWKCRYEESMVAPKRTLVDINPGKAYAAGIRS